MVADDTTHYMQATARLRDENAELQRRLEGAFHLLTAVRPVVANDDLHDRIEAWLVNGGASS